MFKNENTIYLIIIAALSLLLIYNLIIAFKEVKKIQRKNDELSNELKESKSTLNTEILKSIEKDSRIEDLLSEINSLKAEKDKEIKAIVQSNITATEKIRDFYFAHTGKQLKAINPRPARMEIFITDILFHISCQLQKKDIVFDKMILKNKPIAQWYTIHLDDFTDKVCKEYISKGYTVTVFNDDISILDSGSEKYILAENDIQTLLIQCVYMEQKYSLNPESVYALHSTHFRLLKNADKKLLPVLICSSSISEESKHLLNLIGINYRENAIPEIHQINDEKSPQV